MPDSALQPPPSPVRTLVIYLSAILYVAICLAFTAVAAKALYFRLPSLATVSQLTGLLIGYLAILTALDSLLALVFTIIFHGRIFAVIRFIASGLFIVCPATLLTFCLIIWISGPSPLSLSVILVMSSGLVLLAVLLIGIYIWARFVEPRRLQTVFHRIHSPKLPALDRPLRIVLLADIQIDCITPFERRVFQQTLQLKPDLILFAGDYLQCPDSQSHHRTAQLLQELLRDLNFTAPLGVFAVAGNSEARNGRDCFDGTAVHWLIDRSIVLDRAGVSISLTGLSQDVGATDAPMPTSVLAALGSSRFNIVLSHQPDFVLDLPSDHAIDLCLAGHTHGGQICLPFIGALTTACRIPCSQAHGLHCINGTRICISPGIGMERGWATRLRFFCPPQIVVLDLVA